MASVAWGPCHSCQTLPHASRSHLRAEGKRSLVLLKKTKSVSSLDCFSRTYLKLCFSLLSKNFLIMWLKIEYSLSKGPPWKATSLFILHLSFFKIQNPEVVAVHCKGCFSPHTGAILNIPKKPTSNSNASLVSGCFILPLCKLLWEHCWILPGRIKGRVSLARCRGKHCYLWVLT